MKPIAISRIRLGKQGFRSVYLLYFIWKVPAFRNSEAVLVSVYYRMVDVFFSLFVKVWGQPERKGGGGGSFQAGYV